MQTTHLDERRQAISGYIDGRLSERERRELEEHLAGCAECRHELATMRTAVLLLRRMPVVPVPRSFALPVVPRRPPIVVALPWMQRLATLAAALLLLVGSFDVLAGVAAPRAMAPASVARKLEQAAPPQASRDEAEPTTAAAALPAGAPAADSAVESTRAPAQPAAAAPTMAAAAAAPRRAAAPTAAPAAMPAAPSAPAALQSANQEKAAAGPPPGAQAAEDAGSGATASPAPVPPAVGATPAAAHVAPPADAAAAGATAATAAPALAAAPAPTTAADTRSALARPSPAAAGPAPAATPALGLSAAGDREPERRGPETAAPAAPPLLRLVEGALALVAAGAGLLTLLGRRALRG